MYPHPQCIIELRNFQIMVTTIINNIIDVRLLSKICSSLYDKYVKRMDFYTCIFEKLGNPLKWSIKKALKEDTRNRSF